MPYVVLRNPHLTIAHIFEQKQLRTQLSKLVEHPHCCVLLQPTNAAPSTQTVSAWRESSPQSQRGENREPGVEETIFTHGVWQVAIGTYMRGDRTKKQRDRPSKLTWTMLVHFHFGHRITTKLSPKLHPTRLLQMACLLFRDSRETKRLFLYG